MPIFIDHKIKGYNCKIYLSIGEDNSLFDAPGVLVFSLPLPGVDGDADGHERGGRLVLRAVDVAAGPLHLEPDISSVTTYKYTFNLIITILVTIIPSQSINMNVVYFARASIAPSRRRRPTGIL